MLKKSNEVNKLVKINYTGNYPIHALKDGVTITLHGGEHNFEIDKLPQDDLGKTMPWITVVEEPIKASTSGKTAKKKVK